LIISYIIDARPLLILIDYAGCTVDIDINIIDTPLAIFAFHYYYAAIFAIINIAISHYAIITDIDMTLRH
jgi:hypothetical protein